MDKTINYRDTLMRYSILGEGNVLVLLHGFGEDSTIWSETVYALSGTYKLIVPTIAGSGGSPVLKGEAIGMEIYADALHAILKDENVTQCTLIGHSMGGYIALAFAEKYPEMLRAFGLFHSSAYADDDSKKEVRKKAIEFIKDNGVDAFLKTSTPGLFMDIEKSKDAINNLLERGKQFQSEALIQYYQAMIARPDRTHVLRSFEGPVLFMLGAHDKAVPFEQGLEQSHLPAQSHIFILRNSAHMGMLEEPEKCLLNLTDFLHQIYV